MTTEQLDPMIWRKLPSGGAVKRSYYFNGISRGRKCHMVVELVSEAAVPGYYEVRAVFAHNVLFEPEWANLRDLEAID